MTIKISIKNHDTNTQRVVQVKQSDGYIHNIEAGTEKEFSVHADNSFQITEGGNPSAETAAPEVQTEETPVENPEAPADAQSEDPVQEESA